MINLAETSCCLITKDPLYPQEIIRQISSFPFGEILIFTNSDSPFRKYELFDKAKYDYIYYQDDDAICPIKYLVDLSEQDKINVVMKQSHFDAYANTRMTMGLGWGGLFAKYKLRSLKKYIYKYGRDELFKRETERILTYLNYPQNRLVLPVEDLPSAYAADRLWRQPIHQRNIALVEERCSKLVL